MIPSVEPGLFLSSGPLFVSFNLKLPMKFLPQALGGGLEDVCTQLGVERLLIQWDNLASNITGFVKLLTSITLTNMYF